MNDCIIEVVTSLPMELSLEEITGPSGFRVH
jgi:hypothetical protein